MVVLESHLDLLDLLLAEREDYRALWARHYLGMEPPEELSQAFYLWENASELAALNQAAASGQIPSLSPPRGDLTKSDFQDSLRRALKNGKGVYGATWSVNDIQIHIPSVRADAQGAVTVSTVALGGFADRVKSLPETLALEAVRASGLRPVPGPLYLADQAGLSQFSEQRLEILRSERTSPFELFNVVKSVLANLLEPPPAGRVFPPLDRALRPSGIPEHLIDPLVCEWKDRCIKIRFPSSVIGGPQQRRTQAVEDKCFYVNHRIDPESLDPERTAIFVWESLPLCVPDVEEKSFATQVPVIGCGIMGDRIMQPFSIQAMRNPETFEHLIISGLGKTPKNVLHHLVSAPSLLPTWRALGLKDFLPKQYSE